MALLNKLKSAVKGVNQSHVQKAYIRDAQVKLGVFQHALVQPNATRCVSLYGCLINLFDCLINSTTPKPN